MELIGNIDRKAIFRKALAYFNGLSLREKLLVGSAAAVIAIMLIAWPIRAFRNYLHDTEIYIQQRKNDFQNLSQYTQRYRERSQRLSALSATFSKSQMTFEEVTAALDRVVKESIGNDSYDLKRGNTSPEDVSSDYEKQDFTLNIRSLTLEQMIKLLYEIEHGKRPLFLSKVDIRKDVGEGKFSAVLEIGSVRRKQQINPES